MCRRLRDLKKRDQGQHTRRKKERVVWYKLVFFVCVEVLKNIRQQQEQEGGRDLFGSRKNLNKARRLLILFRLAG